MANKASVKASAYDKYIDYKRFAIAVALFAIILTLPTPRSMLDVAFKYSMGKTYVLDFFSGELSGKHYGDIEQWQAQPVIILTGHGDFGTAMAGIKLEIVDFLQKPIDMEQLGMRIRSLLEQGREIPLRERTIEELMVPPSIYPRIYIDEPVAKAPAALRKAFYTPVPEGVHPG